MGDIVSNKHLLVETNNVTANGNIVRLDILNEYLAKLTRGEPQ